MAKLDWDLIKPPIISGKAGLGIKANTNIAQPTPEEGRLDWQSIKAPIYQYKSKSTPGEINKQFTEQQRDERIKQLDIARLENRQPTTEDWEKLIVNPNKPPIESEEVKYTGKPRAIKPAGGGAVGVIGEATALPKQENKWKDVLDVVKLTGVNMVNQTKQAFVSMFPNLFLQDTTPGEARKLEVKYGLPDNSITKEALNNINNKNQEKRAVYEQKYKKNEENFNNWIKAHPELIPRKEWEGGVIQAIKNNPKVLLDPAFWVYQAAQSAIFSIAVTGTTLAATAVTGNPVIGMGAGVAVAYPMQAQDLYEQLVKNGASKEKAAELSVPIGAVIAMVEVAGDLPFLASVSKPFKDILYKNIKGAVVNNIIAKGIGTGAKVVASETLEEIAQEGIMQGTLKTVNENINLLQNIPEITLQTIMSTLPRALIGMGGDIRQNTALNQKLDDIKKSQVEEAIGQVKAEGKGEAAIPAAEKTSVGDKMTPTETAVAEEAISEEVKPAPIEAGKGTLTPIEGTGETKKRGLSVSVEAEAISNKLTEGFGDLPEYKTINNQEQAQKALDIINSDYDLAKKMALGEEAVPKGILPESMFTAVRFKAEKEGDINTIMELATSPVRTAEATTMGQRIQALGVRDPESPVFAIQDINKTLDKANESKVKFSKKIDIPAIDKNIQKAEVEGFSKKQFSNKQTWADFINEIRCK